ncbi:MAG: hypothetical protein COA86_00160 [Kangiella sp.]|nr:MAG: hypothetical protein COA86_00160 [Kangiella sp.]
MKNLTSLLIVGLVLINSQDSYSETRVDGIKADLLVCKGIESNTERLACFDTIVKNHNESDNLGMIDKTVKLQEVSPLTQLKPTLNKTEATDNKLESKQSLTSSKPSNFGMEFADQDAKVESFLVGEFSSWKKGMKLKLKNGQVWKVVNARSGYRRMTNPAITISRGFFGSFNAKIEGLNAKAKVKRIK